jgi:hypothetical protein
MMNESIEVKFNQSLYNHPYYVEYRLEYSKTRRAIEWKEGIDQP